MMEQYVPVYARLRNIRIHVYQCMCMCRGVEGRIKGSCYQWMNTGKCARGDECPFEHDDAKKGTSKGKGKGRGKGNSRSSSQASSAGGDSRKGDGKGKICYWYLKGECRNGENCKFRHPPACTNIAKGDCKFGKKCIYAHFVKPGAAAPANEDAGGNSCEEDEGARGRSPSPIGKKNGKKADNANVCVYASPATMPDIAVPAKPTSCPANCVECILKKASVTCAACTTKEVRFGNGSNKPFWSFDYIPVNTLLRPYPYASTKNLSQNNIRPAKVPLPQAKILASTQSARNRATNLAKELGTDAGGNPSGTRLAAAGLGGGKGRSWIVDSGSCHHLVGKQT